MKRLATIISPAAVIAVCGLCFAGGGDLGSLLKEAQTQAGKGDFASALTSIDKAKVLAFEKAPLALNHFQFVQAPGEAYGVYRPRESNVYKPDEVVYIYSEPAGYTFKKEGDIYKFSLTADFLLMDGEGSVLGGQKNFATFGFQSRMPNTEFMLNLTYTFTGLTPGKYKIETTVKDDNSDKKTSKTLEFEIR